MKKINIRKGDSRFLFVLSLVNFITYAVWLIAYFVCLMLRASAFNSAQTTMALSGQLNYTVEVTSPFFGVLRFFIYLLPVVMFIWTVVLMVTDRKGKALCDNKMIVAVFGADAACAITVMTDILVSHMIF